MPFDTKYNSKRSDFDYLNLNRYRKSDYLVQSHSNKLLIILLIKRDLI